GGAGLGLRLLHGAEDRDPLVALAGLLRVHAGDVAVAAVRVLLAGLGVEHSGLAGDALGHHPGVPADEDGHQRFPFLFFAAFFFAAFFFVAFFTGAFFALALALALGLALAFGFAFSAPALPPAAATTFFAPSAMLLPEMIGRP